MMTAIGRNMYFCIANEQLHLVVFLTEFTLPYKVVNITATVQNPQTCRLCERKTDIS